MSMKLKELTIRKGRSYNDENPHRYYAEIEYEDSRGNVKLALDDRISQALLACIGPAIAEFSTAAAKEIEQSLFQTVQELKQLPVIEEPIKYDPAAIR